MRRFNGKTVFITGAAKGQGRSHAVNFAREGANIIALDLPDPLDNVTYPTAASSDLDATAELVAAEGAPILTFKADVRDYEAVAAAVRAGVDAFGELDVVVANAGVGKLVGGGTVLETTSRAWQDTLDINLTGVWHTVKAAGPHIRSGGAVILTSSSLAIRPRANMSSYLAAKQGVIALAQSLAIELAGRQIRANAVLPTSCDTDMIQNLAIRSSFMPDLENPTREDAERPGSAYYAAHLLDVPWIEPQDVSNAVLFLASEQARYVTGVALPIDAGFALK